MQAQPASQCNETPAQIAARITELVTLPAVYLEVRRVIDDPESGAVDLAKVIASDPAISARVLRVANSAAYRTMRAVGTISQAVSHLGTQRVHDLALASSMASMFDQLPMNEVNMAGFWSRAITTALVARRFAQVAALADAERPFVQGLLAEVGHLAMFQAAAESVRQVIDRVSVSDPSVAEVEVEVLGFHHAEVAGELLRMWCLPDSLIDAIEQHALPRESDNDTLPEALVCHLAWHVAACIGTEETIEERLNALPAWITERLDVEIAPLLEAAAQAVEEADELYAVFFPDLARSA